MNFENMSATMINKLPRIPLHEMKELPDAGCVYFIFSSAELVYVGSTNSLLKRIRSHHRIKQFRSYSAPQIAWIGSGDKDLRREWEHHFIATLKPVLNNERLESPCHPLRGMIAVVLPAWREIHSVGLRECARDIGISHGTLSRIERGLDYDAKTLLLVQWWLFGGGK